MKKKAPRIVAPLKKMGKMIRGKRGGAKSPGVLTKIALGSDIRNKKASRRKS